MFTKKIIFLFLFECSFKFITASSIPQIDPSFNKIQQKEVNLNSSNSKNFIEDRTADKDVQTKLNKTNISYGLTIINHGFQAGIVNSDPFEWMIPMAEAIRNRAGSARILKYNKSTGIFDPLSGYDSSGETILLFDWVTESDNNSTGFSEAAGDALFSALILGELRGDFSLENIHFIGHSRGCTVNSEAIERLIKIGKPVEQVTNLDPHDWGNDFLFQFPTDYDVNADSLIISVPASRSPNRGIVSWEGVGWIDTYWQTNGFGGRIVYGSYSLQLPAIGHSNVHEWYLGTIDDSSGNNSWFQSPYPARNESGFNYSRIGGLVKPAEVGTRQPILFSTNKDGIMNGNFERGPSNNQSEYPGWSDHGGGGNGSIINNKLVLNQLKTEREHNRFFIPPNVDILKFLFTISTAENGSPPSVDKFHLSIKSLNSGNSYELLKEEFTNLISAKWIDIDISNYRNSVSTILFSLEDGGGNGINSEILIDSISFSDYPLQLVNVSVNLEGAISNGIMQTNLLDNQVLSNLQPYYIFPWYYDGMENVVSIPPDVVDWVLIELRDKNDSSKIIRTRAAFLLNTGKIVDLDGISPVSFYVLPDFYYISIQHRNHLAVMSAVPIEIPNL